MPDPRTLFLGLQLAVTAEPTEVGGTSVGLNVAPLVVEWAALPWLGVRGHTVLNLQFAGADTGLAQRGASLTLPVYLPDPKSPTEGFYLGPHVGYTVNPLVDGRDATVAGELGVRWNVTGRWTLNLAGQVGATRLVRPQDDRWVSHLGVFPSFGLWVL